MTPWWWTPKETQGAISYGQATSDANMIWPRVLYYQAFANRGWPAWEQQWADAQGLGINAIVATRRAKKPKRNHE